MKRKTLLCSKYSTRNNRHQHTFSFRSICAPSLDQTQHP